MAKTNTMTAQVMKGWEKILDVGTGGFLLPKLEGGAPTGNAGKAPAGNAAKNEENKNQGGGFLGP